MTIPETPAERRLRDLWLAGMSKSQIAAIDMGREALALLREFDSPDLNMLGHRLTWVERVRALLARANEAQP